MSLRQLGSVIICLLLPAAGVAQTFAPTEPGVTGDVFLGAVYLSQRSQVSANDDAEPVLPSYQASAERTSRVLPGVIGNIAYTFDNLRQQVYAGVSRSNAAQGRFAGELGYRQFLENGTVFEAAYIPSLVPEDVWSDPYQLNGARTETRQQLHAIRSKLERIAGTGFGIELGYGELEVSRERSGGEYDVQAQQQLQRDGHYGYLGLEAMVPVARATVFTPTLYLVDRNADGSASSYEALGAEVRFFHRSGRHTFIANLGYEAFDFAAPHPIFGEPRQDARIKAFFSYLLAQPFGWESTSLTLLSSLNERDSELDFYDESGVFAGLGITYNFR